MSTFGHNPEPVQDFLIEAEILEGELYNTAHGIPGALQSDVVLRRIERVLASQWLDQSARDAQRKLRDLAAAELKRAHHDRR